MVIGTDEVNVVLARLRNMPASYVVSIGSGISLTKDELIKAVEDRNEIGEQIVKAHMLYLRSFKDRDIIFKQRMGDSE